jgi:hypothetical protein
MRGEKRARTEVGRYGQGRRLSEEQGTVSPLFSPFSLFFLALKAMVTTVFLVIVLATCASAGATAPPPPPPLPLRPYPWITGTWKKKKMEGGEDKGERIVSVSFFFFCNSSRRYHAQRGGKMEREESEGEKERRE